MYRHLIKVVVAIVLVQTVDERLVFFRHETPPQFEGLRELPGGHGEVVRKQGPPLDLVDCGHSRAAVVAAKKEKNTKVCKKNEKKILKE